MFVTPTAMRARYCEYQKTVCASCEEKWDRLYPRCRGTTSLVRGEKKLFSKNEVLTRTHSRRADTEVVLKQRVAANGGEGITELVLSEKGIYEKGCFYRRKGSRWEKWFVVECVLQRWACRHSGARLAEDVFWWWCDRCLLITESPKTPGHYRYLHVGSLLHPLYGIGGVQFAIYRVPVYTAISNFKSSCSQRFRAEVASN